MSANTYLKNFQRLKTSVKTINLPIEEPKKTKEEIIEEKVRKQREIEKNMKNI